jgi:formyltetrahydrofolate deformylase
VSSISGFLFKAGANIVHSDQHSTDPYGGSFFLRVEFELPELLSRLPELEASFAAIGHDHRMEWRFEAEAIRKRLAIFASREDHCLLELLWRHRAGDLRADIAMVISNHRELEPSVTSWNVPFHHVPVAAETRPAAERRQQLLLDGRVDAIVLARYMQILSSAFVDRWPNRIVNIHHSFLPAFAGAHPYRQAFDHGVKLIGATAHYVTADLDAGPIIEQDVQRVDHRHTVGDLRRIGRQVERSVLARAVIWHVEDRILVHGNKTLVFA